MYNFVSKKRIIDSFKSSSHFKTYLGYAMSVDDAGERKFKINDKDKFVQFYHNKYKIALLTEGNIGTLNFFSDYYIEDDIVVVFFNDKDFVFKFEESELIGRGVDKYLGAIIKEIETKHEEELANAGGAKANKSITGTRPKGNPDKLINNPGSVTWEDIESYYKKKNNI